MKAYFPAEPPSPLCSNTGTPDPFFHNILKPPPQTPCCPNLRVSTVCPNTREKGKQVGGEQGGLASPPRRHILTELHHKRPSEERESPAAASVPLGG
ncbi:unnamed protein product [Boreogadus saida]